MVKKRTWKWFLIGLGVVVIIALPQGVTNLTVEIKERQTAKHWLQKAEKSAGSTTTFKDAYQWLVDNEFKVMMWNPHQDQGWVAGEREYTKDDETTHLHYIVQGSRQLTKKSFLSDASWIDLKFRFDPEHKFQDVNFIIRRYPLPR